MAAADLILKMSLENQLSPEIKKALDDFRKLTEKASGFKDVLQTFKDNKQGILKGTIESDVAEIRKLQVELDKIKKAYIDADNAADRRALKNQEKSLNADLVSAYNREFTRLARVQKDAADDVRRATSSLSKQHAEMLRSRSAAQRLENATRKVAESQKELGKSSANLRNDVVRHIRQIESLVVGLYFLRQGYDATLGRGHEFNKLIESETIGLKLLISQNLQHVDVLGKAVTAQERYNFSQKEANKAMEIARKINIKTPHSFAETLQIFKLLTPQVLKYGGTLEEVGHITQRMSVIAASMGIEFQQFLKTVDSALSGDMKESGLKRALEQFGVTNEGIKELKKRNGDVVKYVLDGLEQAKSAGDDIFNGWQGIMGQLNNELDDLFGKMQQPLFNAMKEQIIEITAALGENQSTILKTVDGMADLGKHLAILAGAYGTARVATALFAKSSAIVNASLVAHAANVRRASILHESFGKNVSASAIALRRMGIALKSFTVSNLPMLAVVAAFEAYNYSLEETEERLEKIAQVTNKTRNELALLGEQTLSNSKNALNKELEETEKKIREIEKSIKSVGKSMIERGTAGSGLSSLFDDAQYVGYIDAIFGSEKEITAELKEQLELHIKQKAELEKKLKAVGDITPEMQGLAQGAKSLHDIILETNQEITKQANIINAATDKEDAAVVAAKEKKAELEQQLVAQKEALQEANRLLTAAGMTAIEYAKATGQVEDMSKAINAAANEAYKLRAAMIENSEIKGEISKIAAIKKAHIAKVEEIDAMEKTASEKKLLLLEEENRYRTKSAAAHKEMADKRKDAEQSLNNTILANLKAHGKDAEALKLKIDMIQKSELPNKEKLLQIDTLRQEYQNSLLKTSGKATKDLEKEAKELDDIYRTYLELTGQDLKLFELDTDKLMKDLMQLKDKGLIDFEDISKAYDGSWNEFVKKGEKANKKVAMDFTNQFKGLLDGIFSGDFGGALKGFFDGLSTELLSKPIDDLSTSMSEYLTGKDGTGGILSSLGSFGGIFGGLVTSGIGMLVGSLFGDSEEPAPELGEIRDTSESMKNALEYIKDAQFPMLRLTREMTGYLQTISKAFGGVENSLLRSGIDIGGSLFQDTYKKGTLFGGKSTSLYGTSIDVEAASMADLINGEITALLDTVTKTVKTKWYGAKKTSYSHSYTDISGDISEYVSNATKAVFDSLTLAGETLGIDLTVEEEVTRWVADSSSDIQNGIWGGFNTGFGSFFSKFRGGFLGRIFSGFGKRFSEETGQWVTETVTSSLMDEIIDIGKFDTTGMSADEVAAEIQGRFAAQMDMITEKYFGVVKEFQKAGEGLGETLFRVMTNFDQVGHSLELIGKSFDWRTANIIADVAGGLDNFNASMSSYQSNFFTDAEQYEMKLYTLTKSFESLGLAVPNGKAGFRDLVESIDTTTDAGATLFAEVLSLADSFADMESSAKSLGEAISGIADAWLGNLSYLTIAQKAAYASGYFEIARESNGQLDVVDSAKAMAETALRASSTKEEYIPYFDKYIKVLEEQAPQATTDDVVAELRALRAEVQILEETTRRLA